jgi:hypothetical protein
MPASMPGHACIHARPEGEWTLDADESRAGLLSGSRRVRPVTKEPDGRLLAEILTARPANAGVLELQKSV